MTLTDSQRNLMSQALTLAADKYVILALDCIDNKRLKEQFLWQSIDTREMAILIADTVSLEIGTTGYESQARTEAVDITNQQFADALMKIRATEDKYLGPRI